MKSRQVYLIVIILIALVFGYIILRNRSLNTKEMEITVSPTFSPTIYKAQENINLKATFAIFTNGTFRVFTAPMYHNLSTDVYIEPAKPNVVIVKKAGTTWSSFFETMPFTLRKDCLTTGTKQTFCTNETKSLKFYINGKLDVGALDKEIGIGDQLLVSYGDKNDTEIKRQLLQLYGIKMSP